MINIIILSSFDKNVNLKGILTYTRGKFWVSPFENFPMNFLAVSVNFKYFLVSLNTLKISKP